MFLCAFGFLREMRLSEPFAIEYLLNEKNATMNEITQLLIPATTYSYLVQLVLAFLVTDYLRYEYHGKEALKSALPIVNIDARASENNK